jgi:hypothetical protein
VGRRGVVVFDCGGASTVVADDMTLALHHGQRERKVKWGPRRAGRGTTSGSPSGRIGEGSDGLGVRGWRTDSRKDGGGGGVLVRG